MGYREDRLTAELERMERLREQSSFISFVTQGHPPEEYIVTYSCTGLISPQERGDRHLVRIYLPAECPRLPPEVSFLTSIFHPNILALIQIGEVKEKIHRHLANARDEATRNRLLAQLLKDKELFKGRVCLDILELNWSPGITLDLVCLELGEMIQYQHYNLDDPLNHEAADWARAHTHLLPVDTKALRDVAQLERVRIVEEPEIVIHLLPREDEGDGS